MVIAARSRRTADIAAVRAGGRARSGRYLTLRWLPTPLGGVRLTVSASRARSAVARNRARRRVAEAFRRALAARSEAPSVDLLVSARAEAARAPFPALERAAGEGLDAAFGPRA